MKTNVFRRIITMIFSILFILIIIQKTFSQEKKPIYFEAYLNVNSFMRPVWGAEVIKRYIDLWNKYGIICDFGFTDLAAQNIAVVRPDVIQYLKDSKMTIGMHYRIRARSESDWMRETRLLNPLTLELVPDKIGGVLAIQKIFDVTPNGSGGYLGELCRKNWVIAPEEKDTQGLTTIAARGLRLVNADYMRGEALRDKEEVDLDVTTEQYIKIYRLRRELAKGIKTYHPYRSRSKKNLRERLYVLVLWLSQLQMKGFDISAIKGVEKFVDLNDKNLNINDLGQLFPTADDYRRLEVLEEENILEACRLMEDVLEQCERLDRTQDDIIAIISNVISRLDRTKENKIRFAMHDTDFYSYEDYGELTYSVPPGTPIEKLIPAHVRPKEEQEKIWALFEKAVNYVVTHPDVIPVVPTYGITQHLPENNPLLFYQRHFGVNTYEDMLKVTEPEEARNYQSPRRVR